MANNEHILFQDIPLKGNDLHSAVLLTYSLDLVNIDSRIRNILHKKKICSINILADKNQLEKSYSFTDPLSVNNLGRDYTISGIESKGAFHPKINMFIGYNSLTCLLGSGNLTVGGHGKNHELFTGFIADSENTSHLPLIHEIWSYIQTKILEAGDFEQKRILEEIPLNCTLLEKTLEFTPHSLVTIGDDLKAALIYDDSHQSIFSQISNIVPSSEVRAIVVVSPFFDKDGRTLQNLHNEFYNARIDVLTQKDTQVSLSGVNPDDISFYDFDKTTRGKKNFNKFQRKMHCKMILFITNDKKYCFIGSANATEAALGNKGLLGRNAELGVLYVTSHIDFLKELNLEYSATPSFDLKTLPMEKYVETWKTPYSYEIKEATVNYSELSIRLRILDLSHIDSIILDDGNDTTVIKDFITDGYNIKAEKPSINKATMCYLVDEYGNRISNVSYIKSIILLNITNPSKSNRELNGIISKISSEGYAGLEIVDILARVLSDMIEKQSFSSSNRFKSNELKYSDRNLPDINYNPAFNRKENALFSNTQFNQIGSRLLNSIETCIKRKMNEVTNEILDEEEEANSESSYSRTVKYDPTTVLTWQDIVLYPNQVKTLWQTYDKFLKLREAQSNNSDFGIHHDDICFFTLTLFASLEICYLNRSLYEFKNINNLEKSKFLKDLFCYFDNIMGITGVDILQRFGIMMKKHKSTIEREKLHIDGQRAIKYMLIFKYLFKRMFSLLQFRISQVSKIDNTLKTLIEIFGKPTISKMSQELTPLIKKYNNIFVTRDIEYTLDKLYKH